MAQSIKTESQPNGHKMITCQNSLIRKFQVMIRSFFSKKNRLLLLMISSVLFIHGCSDSTPPEDMVYAHGIGVDYVDGEYIIYLQIINLGSIAKTEGGGDEEKDPTEMGRVKAKNLDEALFKLYQSSQIKIYWSDVSFLILTENLLKEKGIQDVMELWNRYPEIRYHINIFSAEDHLEDILLFTPLLSISTTLSKLSRPESSLKQSSFLPMRNMREFVIALNEPGYSVPIPKVYVTKTVWQTNKEPRNMVGFSGVTLYHRDKHYLGKISEEKARGLRWVTNHFTRDQLTMKLSDDNETSLVIKDKKSTIIPFVQNGEIRFKIKINAKASINLFDKAVPLEELRKEAVKTMRKQIQTTYQTALEQGSDIYNLSGALYRKNNPLWKKNQVSGEIPLSKDSIDIDIQLQIKDSGSLRFHPTIES
ncbi:Ger(x)C family germination protein [Oikeobacillus pervagus]|uniref:Ger(X)C family germination protein n=1 Tax=Oikeobacillus pervagus TaxID=1325931 RepID=A0AAJ1SY60_9BACI|nr:Ger(x)C family spore germination protein [Oikeobacillus pervagus]MDQ0214649.1 Ger(x)C family germination protein [Oikeobacillus pervagus]